MTISIHRIFRLLLAGVLALAAGLAQAGAWRVTVDTSGYSGAGSLELSFLGLSNAAPATATASGFSGAFGTDGDLQGSVSGAFPGALVFSNSGTNDFWRGVTLGGMFSFNVDFQLPVAAGANTTFAVSIADGSGYLTPVPVVLFELAPGLAPAITANAAYASVSAAPVPEPSGAALLLGGLAVMGMLYRCGLSRARWTA